MKKVDKESNYENHEILIAKKSSMRKDNSIIKIKHNSLSLNNKTLDFEFYLHSNTFGKMKLMRMKKNPEVQLIFRSKYSKKLRS
jgi:hypothetical protein